MKHHVLLWIILVMGLVLFLCYPTDKTDNLVLEVQPNVTEQYVAKVSFVDSSVRKTKIRLLVLKHCRERIAEEESRDVIQAANLADSEGLDIKTIGNIHVDKQGERVSWSEKMTLPQFKQFLIGQMKVEAQTGDTLVIYTTGHGGSGGSLQILGQREPVARAMAEAAEETKQEVLWWQSSCYAAAGLPDISSFNKKQQKLFSMIASSNEHKPSYWGDQTEPMRKVFVAIAERSSRIDPDQNGVVTKSELAAFMNQNKRGSGDLLFAISESEPIFGWFDWANEIPLIGEDGQEIKVPDDFVPHPSF